MTDKLTFAADIDIQAAAGGEKKLPTFSIVAYTGGPMTPGGFYTPVVVDLSGIKAGSTAVLLDHDPSQIIGQGQAEVVGGQVVVKGTITGDDQHTTKVLTHAKNGFRWQASIGANIDRREFLEAGKKATVNGREITGPAVIARESSLYEVSFVALGADSKTSAVIAARREPVMSDLVTEPNLESVLQAERDRTRGIAAAAARLVGDYPLSQATIAAAAEAAIADGTPADAFELAVIRGCRAPMGVSARRTTTPDFTDSKVLQASLMIRANAEAAAVKVFGEATVEAARKARITNMVDLCGHVLRAAGHSPDQFDTRDSMIRAAFSTSQLPIILSNVVGRTLEMAYAETTTKWRQFCYVASAANFKPQSAIRPSAIQNLEKLNGGEIKHGVIQEEDICNWKVSTYAKMLGVTREDIINDDLGFVAELAPMLGTAAGRTLNDLIWSTILDGQTASFFSSGNANLAESGSALAIGTLGAGVTAMRKQRDSQNFDIDISPAVLVVPPDLEQTARPILNSTELLGLTSGTQPSGNPVFNIVPSLIVESRISNTDRFTNASTTQWFLFAAPSARGVTVGFLDGRQAPVVELQDAPFDRLGIQMRVYHDFGCALSDPKAAYKATGAAGG